MLKIRRVTKTDFGSYKCVAKNSLGETDGVIKLEGKLNTNHLLFTACRCCFTQLPLFLYRASLGKSCYSLLYSLTGDLYNWRTNLLACAVVIHQFALKCIKYNTLSNKDSFSFMHLIFFGSSCLMMNRKMLSFEEWLLVWLFISLEMKS